MRDAQSEQKPSAGLFVQTLLRRSGREPIAGVNIGDAAGDDEAAGIGQ
jgi:hypothetical protein